MPRDGSMILSDVRGPKHHDLLLTAKEGNEQNA
jgi:hypothetical protein